MTRYDTVYVKCGRCKFVYCTECYEALPEHKGVLVGQGATKALENDAGRAIQVQGSSRKRRRTKGPPGDAVAAKDQLLRILRARAGVLFQPDELLALVAAHGGEAPGRHGRRFELLEDEAEAEVEAAAPQQQHQQPELGREREQEPDVAADDTVLTTVVALKRQRQVKREISNTPSEVPWAAIRTEQEEDQRRVAAALASKLFEFSEARGAAAPDKESEHLLVTQSGLSSQAKTCGRGAGSGRSGNGSSGTRPGASGQSQARAGVSGQSQARRGASSRGSAAPAADAEKALGIRAATDKAADLFRAQEYVQQAEPVTNTPCAIPTTTKGIAQELAAFWSPERRSRPRSQPRLGGNAAGTDGAGAGSGSVLAPSTIGFLTPSTRDGTSIDSGVSGAGTPSAFTPTSSALGSPGAPILSLKREFLGRVKEECRAIVKSEP